MRLLFQRQMALNAQLGQPSALEQFFATQAEPLEEPKKEPEVPRPEPKEEPFIPEEGGPLQSRPLEVKRPVLQSTVKPPRGQAPTGAGAFVEGMVKRGWTPEEAAGAAGNVQVESGFRPDIKSKAPGENSYGYLQWNKDRLRGLQNMAAATNRDWRDPEAQMDWINMERTGESVKYGGSNEKKAYAQALAQGGSPEEIAERFGRYVERPRDLSASLTQRQQYARQYAEGTATAAPSAAFDTEAQVTPTTSYRGPGSKTTTPTTEIPVYPARGFVFHHSGGSTLKELEDTLRARKLGSQYLMDRDGTIYSFAGAGSPHIKPNDRYGGIAPGLSNANAVGMEIVAKDDNDLTPAQVASARRFIAEKYPNVPVYGHGEVNPGHKQAREGMTVVEAIRADRAAHPGLTDDEALAGIMQSLATG
jgi:Phage tail lysozyme/N-acetylmuramoyl-L-alanine amidase